ncbi:hypothetical protein UFOVP1290_133 [uncultured Caudovirales phage]|uniref:Uncharacterized protein n=1 Tax=uncultured Caudovirales phage TaxID=2100421 RepID=A0A6J5RGZ0_9CAUD|nr:hypothetical protein UFOVP1290_133 [uncultured Caudovirales phage]
MKISCPTCKDELSIITIESINHKNYDCKKCKFHVSFNTINNEIIAYNIYFKKIEHTYILNSYNMPNLNIVQTNLKLILKTNKQILPIFSDIKLIIFINKFIQPKDYSNINDYLSIANKLFNIVPFS